MPLYNTMIVNVINLPLAWNLVESLFSHDASCSVYIFLVSPVLKLSKCVNCTHHFPCGKLLCVIECVNAMTVNNEIQLYDKSD